MDSETQEYVQLIQTAFSSTSNEVRSTAEQQLLNKCCQQQNGMEIIIKIVMSQDQQDSLRECAALLTSTIIKKLLSQTTPYDSSLQMIHVELFVQCLKSASVNYKLKGYVASSLASLQTFSSRSSPDSKSNQRLQLQHHCKQLLHSQDINLIEGGCFIFSSLISSLEIMSSSDDNFDWVQSFVSKGHDIVQAVSKAQQNNVQQMLNLQKIWCSNAFEMCRRVLKVKGSHKDQMLYMQNFLVKNESFSISLLQVLVFSPQQNNQCMISQTGDILADNLINEAKYSTLSCINLILNILMNERQKGEIRRNPFYIQLTQLLPTLIVCLIGFTTGPQFDINESLNQPHISNMITQMLKFITLCGGQSEFYNVLSESKTGLLVDVLLPLIATSKQEAVMMMEEPEEFVNLALDTIDKQSSDIPKTSAAALLEVFCDHIDGSTSFISQFCALIINQAVHQIKENSDGQILDPNSPFILLKELSKRYFFTQISPAQRIDASLVTLTIMSYLLSRRTDLIQLLELLLKENYLFFSDPNIDPLITVRLCLFLGYYCDNLFKAEGSYQNLQQYIQILISQLTNNNKQWRLAVMYQSVDALKNMFEDEDLVPKVKVLVPWLFPQLCTSLLGSSYEQHFDMIMSLLKIYQSQIDRILLTTALEVLVQRILIEQQNVQQGKKSAQLWINKAWNIIKSLNEIDGYLPQHLNLIEQHLIPLFQLLEHPQLVEFDEDIFLMVSAMIQKTQVVTEAQKKLLYLCPAVQKKQKGRLGQMFEMLNNYIFYGKEIFQDVNIQKLLFEICQQAMVCRCDVANEADEGEGVLLIQLAIQRLGPMIHIDVLKLVFQAILSRSSQNVSQNFLKSRFLGVFLSSFLYDFDRTRSALQELGLLDQIFSQIVDNSFLCEPGYDIKLYVFAMCSILQTFPQVFSSHLIDSLVSLLYRQQEYENKKQSKQKDLIDDFEDDDNSEEYIDDEESDFDEEKSEAQISLESFKSEVIDKDEYEAFRTTIYHLKQNLPDQINQLKNDLTPQKLQFLQNMLGFARVTTDGQLGAPRKIVKVLKRKTQ